MSIAFRAMREGEEDAIAVMVRQLPKDLGLATVPKLTGDVLRRDKDLVKVTVAENSGLLVGMATWNMVYSSWRAARGIYICDLYVMSQVRGRGIGERILAAAAREAAQLGAVFMKLETDSTNAAGLRFYERLKFSKKPSETLHFLEPDEFKAMLEGSKT
jgi:ribosomal protein S18 acetylase RimI-like enzyme